MTTQINLTPSQAAFKFFNDLFLNPVLLLEYEKKMTAYAGQTNADEMLTGWMGKIGYPGASPGLVYRALQFWQCQGLWLWQGSYNQSFLILNNQETQADQYQLQVLHHEGDHFQITLNGETIDSPQLTVVQNYLNLAWSLNNKNNTQGSVTFYFSPALSVGAASAVQYAGNFFNGYLQVAENSPAYPFKGALLDSEETDSSARSSTGEKIKDWIGNHQVLTGVGTVICGGLLTALGYCIHLRLNPQVIAEELHEDVDSPESSLADEDIQNMDEDIQNVIGQVEPHLPAPDVLPAETQRIIDEHIQWRMFLDLKNGVLAPPDDYKALLQERSDLWAKLQDAIAPELAKLPPPNQAQIWGDNLEDATQEALKLMITPQNAEKYPALTRMMDDNAQFGKLVNDGPYMTDLEWENFKTRLKNECNAIKPEINKLKESLNQYQQKMAQNFQNVDASIQSMKSIEEGSELSDSNLSASGEQIIDNAQAANQFEVNPEAPLFPGNFNQEIANVGEEMKVEEKDGDLSPEKIVDKVEADAGEDLLGS